MDEADLENNRFIINGIIYEPTGEYYFGHCLNENHDNLYANISKENWFYCPICKKKWISGWGLLSDPPESLVGNLTTYWKKNKNMLENYEDCSAI